MVMSKHKVVIVGGGFGGIKAALELADDTRFQITLVSDQSNFRYYPTLYHAATGGRMTNASIPLATILEDKKIKLIHGEAVSLDKPARSLSLKDGSSLGYDSLVLSLGVVTNYFGIAGMQEYSYSIKSIEEIARFKHNIHQQLADESKPDISYVIVGAGPTGIELAGALPNYIRAVMSRHGIKHKAVHVDLIEAAPRLLPRMPRDTSRAIGRRLRGLGVTIHTGQAVQSLTADDLVVSGKPIRSHSVVWTAGTTNHAFFKDNGFTISGRGKVATDIYLQADDNIYVIGDNANTPYSGMAQTALHDGIYVAGNLKRKVAGKDLKSYKAKKPITVIPVGEHWAAVIWGKLHLYGWIGWMLREAADWIGFGDYEPWWKASKQWLTEFGHEEVCDICTAAETSGDYSGF